MKRRGRITKPLMVFSIGLLASYAVGYGSWVYYIGNTEKQGNKLPTSSDKKVCYIGKTYYTSIGKAIESSKNGDTIVVIPGNKTKNDKNYIIAPTKSENIAKKSLEIPSGVTLSFPYQEGASNTKKPQNNGLGKGCTINIKDGSGNLTYLTSCAWLADSITLINNGTIEIGGVLGSYSGNNPTGGISGNFSALFLGKGSTLQNYGTLNLYGLLGETSKNNGSSLVCEPAAGQSKAYVNLPFFWYDYCGGSALKAIYDQIGSKKCLPVDDFFFNNITPSATFKKGAIVTSWVNLNAASYNGEYDLSVIDDNGSGILTIKDGGYINCDYDEDTLISKLDLFGAISINEFKIDVKTAIKDGVGGLKGDAAWGVASAIGVPSIVTSTSGYFPVSYHWNITMNKNDDGDGSFNGDNGRFKLLNGAKLKVGEGTSFSFSELVGYNGEDYYTGRGTHASVLKKSKDPNRLPSEIVVNGNISGSLVAATISSEIAGASIITTVSTSATTYEPKAGEGDKTSAKMYDGEQGWFYIYPQLKLIDQSGTLKEIKETGKYCSNASGQLVYWCSVKDIIGVSISSPNGNSTGKSKEGKFKLVAKITPEDYTSSIVSYKWHVSDPSGGSGGKASFDDSTSSSPTITIPANGNWFSDIKYTVWLELTFTSSQNGSVETISSEKIMFVGSSKI